jgi:predicted PP-loop superfamily ATPase
MSSACSSCSTSAASAVAARSAGVQEKVAAAILKANIAAEKSAVLALLGATQQDNSSLANVSAGIGGNLNVTV